MRYAKLYKRNRTICNDTPINHPINSSTCQIYRNQSAFQYPAKPQTQVEYPKCQNDILDSLKLHRVM